MIDHTIEQIEQTRKFFQSEGFSLVQSTIAGRNLEYYLIPQSFHTPLPDFIYRVTNDATKKHIMGVSTSVPEGLQPYFILAEYVEFIEIGLNQTNRVMRAEEIVISTIPKQLLKDYLERKIRLYNVELELDAEHPDTYLLGSEGRTEFDKAIHLLERKLKDIQKET